MYRALCPHLDLRGTTQLFAGQFLITERSEAIIAYKRRFNSELAYYMLHICYIYMCATLRNAFTCILPAGPRILSVRMQGEPRPWLAPDTVLVVRSSKARDGMSQSADNDMDREPGIGDEL